MNDLDSAFLQSVAGLSIEERARWAIEHPEAGMVRVPSAHEVYRGSFIAPEITSNCFGLVAWIFRLEEQAVPLLKLKELANYNKLDFLISRNKKGDVPYLGIEAFEHILHSNFREGTIEDIGALAIYKEEKDWHFQRNPALQLAHACAMTRDLILLHQWGWKHPYTTGRFDGNNQIQGERLLTLPTEGLTVKTYVPRE